MSRTVRLSRAMEAKIKMLVKMWGVNEHAVIRAVIDNLVIEDGEVWLTMEDGPEPGAYD